MSIAPRGREIAITVDGRTRRAIVRLPPDGRTTPRPLVVAFPHALAGRVADTVLQQLEPQRREIEAALGETVEWNPHPERSDKVIRLTRDAEISDRSEWPEIIQWLTQKAVAFKQVFAPRLLAIDLSAPEAPRDSE